MQTKKLRTVTADQGVKCGLQLEFFIKFNDCYVTGLLDANQTGN